MPRGSSDFNRPTPRRSKNPNKRKDPYLSKNLSPVAGTLLRLKRLDKRSGGQHPYCVFTHDWYPSGNNPKKAPLKQKKVANYIVYIISYPTPMCRTCWKEFLTLYTSALPPDLPTAPSPALPPDSHTDPPQTATT